MLKKVFAAILCLCLLAGCGIGRREPEPAGSSVFRIISGSENRDVENLLTQYARDNNISIQIDYAGTIDIMQLLNRDSSKYDACWLSNSIWLYMLNDSSKMKYSKFTSINPVVFGIRMEKARTLGFTQPGREVYMADILQAVKDKNLSFVMPSATRTNSGASAYLGFLSCLAGNPEVLTNEDLQNDDLKNELKELFKGVARSSGDEDLAGEIFLNGDYESIVGYEASIIRLNKTLEAQGQEPLYLVYPYDGVSLSDSPFAYIDNNYPDKQEQFEALQDFLLSASTQQALTATGRRGGYGGLVPYGDNSTFNPDWGIDRSKYLSPIKYPSAAVIRDALNLYQDELKKPSHVVFCLDYSGSMGGSGERSLNEAMEYILNYDKASEDFLQFSRKDIIGIIPFNSSSLGFFETRDGADTAGLLTEMKEYAPNGGTNIYEPAIRALNLLAETDGDAYSRSIILMTDGMSNTGSFYELLDAYEKYGNSIPIFSITFGSADDKQLKQIAELTNAIVVDGRKDLSAAFKDVRGYN